MDNMNVARRDFLDLFVAGACYKVPRWQRRYRWKSTDIKRLIADLVAVANSTNPLKRHYGGTLLTKMESVPPGTRIQPFQVVDGQQRLTTVSILLSCIADAMTASNMEVDDWTGPEIKENMVFNPTKKNRYKMRLQDGDNDAYRLALDGESSEISAVSQARRILNAAVNKNGAEVLFKGLQRLQVVSIGLGRGDDPQQIFESLNATGRPLTESEKLKNWFLMGLSDEKQEELYNGPWLRMERALQAEVEDDESGRIDQYLRDFLRWKTGVLRGRGYVYEDFRRWALKCDKDENRLSLCRELAEASRSYGNLISGGGPHWHKDVEKQLVHLRAIGLDTHRPFTLRLLHESRRHGESYQAGSSLAQVLAMVGTWVTRFWLADRPMAGMNRAFATLAHGKGPMDNEDPVAFWTDQIKGFRGSRVEVPTDHAVREGARTRKAYGGAATRATKAILCALMEQEQRGGAPARESLTVEHLMPQKLTDEWRQVLGPDADEIRRWHAHRIGNLTISGVNSELGNRSWQEKRYILKHRSGVLENHRIASRKRWDPGAMEERTQRLTESILTLWPWVDQDDYKSPNPQGWGQLAWRLKGMGWRDEATFRDALLNVASALISHDHSNGDRLLGSNGRWNLQLASEHPPSSMRSAVPKHPMYTMYVNLSAPAIVNSIRQMGDRCKSPVELDITIQAFWRTLEAETGGIPGQRDEWLSGWQRSSPVNGYGDRVHFTLNETWIGMYIRAHEESSPSRTARIRRASRKIRNEMPDQENDGIDRSEQGSTITVRQDWQRSDRSEWPEMAIWVKSQFSRLEGIAREMDEERGLSSADA